MLRVGVKIEQIENKHLQNWLIFRVWIIWGGTNKIWGALPPNAPRGYGPGLAHSVLLLMYSTEVYRTRAVVCVAWTFEFDGRQWVDNY